MRENRDDCGFHVFGETCTIFQQIGKIRYPLEPVITNLSFLRVCGIFSALRLLVLGLMFYEI
jgi:hypothetical protein